MTPPERFRVSASAIIEERAGRVYGILADYKNAHPRILPKRYFGSLDVMGGGVGAGTTFFQEMRLPGRAPFVYQEVSEPEPGRLLEEKDPDSGGVTSFLVEPMGAFTRVTITTELETRPGLTGAFYRWMSGFRLNRIYSEELKLLAEYCFKVDELTPASRVA